MRDPCVIRLGQHILAPGIANFTAMQPPVFNGLSKNNQTTSERPICIKICSRNHQSIESGWTIFEDEEVCYQKNYSAFNRRSWFIRVNKQTKIAVV